MPSNTSYRRPVRPRPTRNPPPSDAIVVALTAQVLACILLLLAAVIARQLDEQGYGAVKRQYSLLVSDPSQGAELLDEVAGLGRRLPELFTSMEEGIASILERFTGDPMADHRALPPEATPETDVEEPVSPTEEPTEARPAAGFHYNYLDAGDIVGTGLGQGGMHPVTWGGQAGQAAPEGATFAQVMVSGKVKPPVTGVVTSEFHYRDHPVTGEGDFHNGIDIAAPWGKDILAALPGVVIDVGESDIYGNTITIQHGKNLQTFYAHCSQILAPLGAAVRQGDRIARVGSTGVSTGPHLHFSVLVDGLYTDPYWVLRDNIQPVG